MTGHDLHNLKKSVSGVLYHEHHARIMSFVPRYLPPDNRFCPKVLPPEVDVPNSAKEREKRWKGKMKKRRDDKEEDKEEEGDFLR